MPSAEDWEVMDEYTKEDRKKPEPSSPEQGIAETPEVSEQNTSIGQSNAESATPKASTSNAKSFKRYKFEAKELERIRLALKKANSKVVDGVMVHLNSAEKLLSEHGKVVGSLIADLQKIV